MLIPVLTDTAVKFLNYPNENTKVKRQKIFQNWTKNILEDSGLKYSQCKQKLGYFQMVRDFIRIFGSIRVLLPQYIYDSPYFIIKILEDSSLKTDNANSDLDTYKRTEIVSVSSAVSQYYSLQYIYYSP